jgi:hypothetical protein
VLFGSSSSELFLWFEQVDIDSGIKRYRKVFENLIGIEHTRVAKKIFGSQVEGKWDCPK